MSLKSEGGTQQAQDPQLVAVEVKIKKLEDEIEELKGKTDEFSKQCYLSNKAELIELRKKENLLRASSATSTAQQGK